MAVMDALRPFSVPARSHRPSLDELFALWHDALVACLPDVLRPVLARGEQRLIVVPDGATARLYLAQGEERRALGELDPGAPGALQAVLGGGRRRRGKMLIEVPAGQVLTRSVSFPVQVRENLGQVMRYEIDRISPFQAERVCFDYRQGDGPARSDKIAVELALCRRDRVQDWLDRLREAGAPVDRITWEGAWPKANLLPAEERPQRRGSAFGATRILLMLVLLLAAAALVTPLWQQQQVLDELDADLRRIKPQAEEVAEVRSALERAREGSVAVLQRKLAQPRMIDLLRELTLRLPDDTWVQNLDVGSDGEVQVRGESAQATALIGLLEKAPGISGVAFSSPVVQVATTGFDRFHISFKFERGEQP